MIHWALVDTLANIGKGLPTILTRSMNSKAFSASVSKAMSTVRHLYSTSINKINNILQEEASISYVLDNYQRVHSRQSQTDGKSALTHRGTAFSCKQNKIIPLPLETKLISPEGASCKVASSHQINPYTVMIDVIYDDDQTQQSYDVMWPVESMGWKVQSVPGLHDQPNYTLEYLRQHIPSPLLLQIPDDITNDSLIFSSRNYLTTSNFIRMETSHYFYMLKRADRAIKLFGYSDHLKIRAKQQEMAVEQVGLLWQMSDSENHFVDCCMQSSTKCYHARTFQNDMIMKMFPHSSVVDEFIFFPLCPCDEISNEGESMWHECFCYHSYSYLTQ